jgi:nucleoside 2-deoxyribosyltransferase
MWTLACKVMQREETMEQCPICNENIEYRPLGSRDAYRVTCPRCGVYHLTRTALVNLRNIDFSNRQIANISGWLYDNSKYEITSDSIQMLEHLKTPPFNIRADKFLEYLEKKTEYAGQFVVENKSWLGAGWCINKDELLEIIAFLQETGRIHNEGVISELRLKIRPEGWEHLENLKKINSDKNQGFVAMWFSDEMQQIYDIAIANAIIGAGYVPHRVDQREHNDKIDDEIISQIRKSRFVFADFTGHRGGVYFEAGFAKGLGLEVFWSCREDDLDNLHFDIRQYNCITWNKIDIEGYLLKIKYRIEAVLGQGPYKQN